MELTDVTLDTVRPSADSHPSHTSSRRLARLTPRELQITKLVSFGETSKSIGRRLGISFRTVEAHRAHIIAKLGTRSLAELVLLTLGEWPERGLADPEMVPQHRHDVAMLGDPEFGLGATGREEQSGQSI